MQPASWTPLDHTADAGLEVRAPTRASLFTTAAMGLFDLITDLAAVAPRQARPVDVSAPDLEQLLVRWLAELLYLHEAEGLLFSRFEIQDMSGTRVRGLAWGEPYDPRRHPIKTELKAVTYHQIQVARDDAPDTGWRARVIVDV